MIYKKQQYRSYLYRRIILLFFCLFFSVNINAQTVLESASFKVENPTTVLGGGSSSSSSFQLINSLGEFVIGESSSLSFGSGAGFLYFFDLPGVVPPVDPPSGGGSVSGSRPWDIVKEYVLDPSHLECRIADFNCDGRVDIKDLSILLFYEEFSGSTIIPFDLSVDGKIDLMDASIMFYHWDI